MLNINNMSEIVSPEILTRQPDVRFNIQKLIEVDPSVQSVAEQAITAIWKKYSKEPVVVNLTFASHVTTELDNGILDSFNSAYDPVEKRILIAVDTIKERHPDVSVELLVVLQAGHEARHLVQQMLGDPAPDSRTTIASGDYFDDRHENEAWQSAIDAL
jgi:hypothetical protein